MLFITDRAGIVILIISLVILLLLFWICWHETEKLQDYKVNLLSVTSGKPYLRIVEGFLTPEECRHLIGLCQPRFQKSNVIKSDGKSGQDATVRTSSSCMFRKGEDSIVQAIEERAARVAGVPVSHLEALQIVRYEPGQEYKAHNDWFNHDEGIDNQRYMTLFVYLNDDFTGGETEFTNLDYKTVPKMGSAVIWQNCDRNETKTCYQEAMHRGVPPEAGVKYGLNIWIRFKPNT